MEAELLQEFISETHRYLPDIREGINSYVDDPDNIDLLQNCCDMALTIKGAASMMGMTELSRIARELEFEIENIICLEITLTDEETNILLDKVSQIEMMLAEAMPEDVSPFENDFELPTEMPEFTLVQPLKAMESEGDTSAFREQAAQEISAESFESFDTEDDFEIDPEMLEVFAEEAEDHLRNIGANLETLENDLNNRESLLEIRRSAHTLKGAAGIVGFKKISTLAHRVEDLLDHLADNDIESNSSIFDILIAATESLEALTNGDKSEELEQRIKEIYAKFDEMMKGFQGGAAKHLPAVSDKEIPAPAMAENPPVSQTMAAVNQAVAENAEQPDSSHPAIPQKRSTIRVSIERLDDLVKLVSEMVITRSVFEQRIMEMEQQVKELHHSTSRLKVSTSRLETDFEAKSFGSIRPVSSAFRQGPQNVSPYFNRLFEEFDTLEMDRYTDFHQTTRELVETSTDTSAITADLDNVLGNLSLLFDNQRRLIEEMQDSLLRLRMVPLNSLSPRLHRTVRATAFEEGKLAELEIENENIEIDTQIFDAFVEPIVHLLRNAVAHGIESPENRKLLGKPEKGRIGLKAYSEGTHIVFVVSDDGRGISIPAIKEKAFSMGFITKTEVEMMSDEEALELIFLPGLSTANQVNQVSGRGVGMNVVKSNITRRGGTVSIKSTPQKGTSFIVRLPMSLAVTRALLIKADEHTFAFPLKLVKSVAEISVSELEKASAERSLRLGDTNYKLFYFNDLLNLHSVVRKEDARIPLLLLETTEASCALVVDQILKPEEIVIKPLGNLLNNAIEILGATILGDGSVVPVLDLMYLLKKKPSKSVKAAPVEIKAKTKLNVLIVDDSPSVRQINSNLVKKAGWNPIIARDGVDAMEILQDGNELPDIILTDVEMPRMDGYELVASLKRHEGFNCIPIIMITSRNTDKHRQKALDLGVSYFLTKPYEENILVDKVKELTA